MRKKKSAGRRAVDKEGWVSLFKGLELKASSPQINAPITFLVNQFRGNSPLR